MSAAYVTSSGTVVQLDRRADPDICVTPEDVQDREKLARLLQRALRDLAELRRRWNPRVIYFRDVAVTTTTTTVIRLEHGFDGRVNWEVACWDASVAGTEWRLEQHADTSANTLCLVSSAAGTVTVRIEEAG